MSAFSVSTPTTSERASSLYLYFCRSSSSFGMSYSKARIRGADREFLSFLLTIFSNYYSQRSLSVSSELLSGLKLWDIVIKKQLFGLSSAHPWERCRFQLAICFLSHARALRCSDPRTQPGHHAQVCNLSVCAWCCDFTKSIDAWVRIRRAISRSIFELHTV